MEKEFVYKTHGTCSRQMIIVYEGNIIKSFTAIGGCNGNLKGIGALVKGRTLEEVYHCLKGITCGPKSTSCPDQLACAIEEICKIENISL